jgi:hypothetical protein
VQVLIVAKKDTLLYALSGLQKQSETAILSYSPMKHVARNIEVEKFANFTEL